MAVGSVVDVVDRIESSVDGRTEYHYVLVEYLCAVAGGLLAAASDAADARFVGLGELAPYRLTAQTSIVIQKAIERFRASSEG